MRTTLGLTAVICLSAACTAHAEWTGRLALMYEYFPDVGIDARPLVRDLTLAFDPEYYGEWDGGDVSVVFHPHIRLTDPQSDEMHLDFREAYWMRRGEAWDLRIGFIQESWGVVESKRVGDPINQKEQVQPVPLGREKLGQPAFHFTWYPKRGKLDLYYLPVHRRLRYPTKDTRPTVGLDIKNNWQDYEADWEEWAPSFAARYSRNFGNIDLALWTYAGTGRQPLPVPALPVPGLGELRLPGLTALGGGGNIPVEALDLADRFGFKVIPFYQQVWESGVELQYTGQKHIWKYEAKYRWGTEESSFATSAGWEWTKYGLFGSKADVRVLAEYHFEHREKGSFAFFNNDLFAAARLAFNDAKDTNILLGSYYDVEIGTTMAVFTFQRSIRSDLVFKLNGRYLIELPKETPVRFSENVTGIGAELAYYF